MAERLRFIPLATAAIRADLTVHRTSLIYELAYLRAFNQWESFLEETLLRHMCGYSIAGVISQPVAIHYSNVSAARTALYANAQYLLWHDPAKAVTRANAYLVNSPYAAVLAAGSLIVSRFAVVRHRIAHDQTDAKSKFDVVTMALAGKRFPGSRPGLFLRSETAFGNQPTRWLQRICAELGAIAGQIAP